MVYRRIFIYIRASETLALYKSLTYLLNLLLMALSVSLRSVYHMLILCFYSRKPTWMAL